MAQASEAETMDEGVGQAAARDAVSSLAAARIAGRYDVLGLLGSGGMGNVYRVRDVELDEVVALKFLRRELPASPKILERFRQVARLARRVTHANVARTFDIGEHAGEKFLTMEFVNGESLGATRMGDTELILQHLERTRGIARHAPADIAAMGRADVDALVGLLADRPWFFGDAPTKTDASAFGLLAVAIKSPLPTPVCTYAREQPTLAAFVDRGLARFFPDG